MKTIRLAGLFLILSGVLLISSFPARGDTTVYWDSDNGFDPSTVIINPGEKVTWIDWDLYTLDVNITFDGGSPFLLYNYFTRNNFSYTVIFPSATGVYHYQSDNGSFRNGYVVVNAPPTVSITAPADNAVFPAPATFTFQASASDTADDAISDVEFFLGDSEATNSIEDVFSPPFSTTLSNLGAGTYTLIAVARDSYGWTSTSVITITVTDGGAVNLTSPRMDSGKFLFDVTGLTAGKTNIVQASTNLVSWTAIQTNIAASAAMTVTNDPTSAQQFFRILQLP